MGVMQRSLADEISVIEEPDRIRACPTLDTRSKVRA